MDVNVTSVDLVKGGVLISFDDGATVLFDAEFLLAHREDEGNKLLCAEDVEED